MTTTHAEDAVRAAGIAAEYLVGFGERSRFVRDLRAGDSADIDAEITNSSGQVIARVRVNVYIFGKPVDKIVRSVP